MSRAKAIAELRKQRCTNRLDCRCAGCVAFWSRVHAADALDDITFFSRLYGIRPADLTARAAALDDVTFFSRLPSRKSKPRK